MHKFHHGDFPEINNAFFHKVSTVDSYQTRFANMENYFIQQISNNAKKINFL